MGKKVVQREEEGGSGSNGGASLSKMGWEPINQYFSGTPKSARPSLCLCGRLLGE